MKRYFLDGLAAAAGLGGAVVGAWYTLRLRAFLPNWQWYIAADLAVGVVSAVALIRFIRWGFELAELVHDQRFDQLQVGATITALFDAALPEATTVLDITLHDGTFEASAHLSLPPGFTWRTGLRRGPTLAATLNQLHLVEDPAGVVT